MHAVTSLQNEGVDARRPSQFDVVVKLREVEKRKGRREGELVGDGDGFHCLWLIIEELQLGDSVEELRWQHGNALSWSIALEVYRVINQFLL